MSITAMKQARAKIISAQGCHPNATRTLLDEADELLCVAISEAEKQEPFCWLYYERGEEMFAPPDGYRPDDAQPLYLAPQQAQPAPKQEPSYRSVPHGHCTHPKCKELFQEYLVLSEKIAKYEPEGKSPMILNAAPKQEQCWCTTCKPITMSDMRFVVCPDCGNKRCPKAHNHANACTGSNEPGQVGSSWEHVEPVQAQKDVTEPAFGNMAQERKPLIPCTCYDDVARKYCTKKRECTRCEAYGIKEQP